MRGEQDSCWPTKRLGEVLTIARDTVLPSAIQADTAYLGLEDISGETGETSVRSVGAGELRSGKFAFSPEHVLYGKLRPNLRKVARPTVVGICSTDILPLLPSAGVERDYLYHWLRRPDVVELVASRTTGVNLPRIAPQRLLELEIPLPPLAEQRRIAALLDRVDAVRRKRAESRRLVDELLRSVFLEMFGDPVRNEKGWEVVSLRELAQIRRGSSPRPIEEFMGGTVPWIKIGDATESTSLYIERTDGFVTEEGARRSVLVHPGAIVVANSGVSLGFARILGITGCIHDGWLSVEQLDSRAHPVYFVSLINALTETLRASAPTGTQPNLNTEILGNLSIALPPTSLQDRFVGAVSALKRLADRVHSAGREAGAFAAALSAQLMSGE